MKAKYDRICKDYNSTRKADPYLANRMYQLLSPEETGIYLDIGCGTGNYTKALAAKGVNLIGIDPSNRMLQQAQSSSNQIDWRLGTAEQTGLSDQSVDGIMASLTIHHWSDLNLGFKELYRVLKPGKNMLIYTSTAEQTLGYWLNHYFPVMLQDSAFQMPALQTIEQAIASAGWQIEKTEKYFVRPDVEDLFLYSGKHRPKLYFNKQVRDGISSFSDLAHQPEVENGLKQLDADIKSGKISEIIRQYENDLGDYLFISALKHK